MSKRVVTLEDKYGLAEGRVFATGIQALVRLPLDQHRLDKRNGLNTAGYITGYRGSPLGGYDQQLERAGKFLDAENIKFQEGLNEDLAATAVWGSQQIGLFPGARFDGVFGLWYGKTPGVDRTGDAFKHANMAGTSPKGGVLAVAGDDHLCKSSTLPAQSEFALMDSEIPILNPSGVQEVLDFGLYGWAMSRYTGAWASLIALVDTMDAGAVIEVGLDRLRIVTPTDFEMPPGGLGIRQGDEPMEKERRLRLLKTPAAQAFARANKLDRVVLAAKKKKLGIVAAGQALRDVFEALEALGLTPEQAADAGVGVFKVAMTWPLEPTAARAFAEEFETVLVVEHKRPVIEPQLKQLLFHAARRPRVLGKTDETGAPLFTTAGVVATPRIAEVIHGLLPEEARTDRAKDYFARVARSLEQAKLLEADVHRRPHFCSGCPHNTSTVTPDGSRAMAGIGCHYMATFIGRADMASQMGGEGAGWLGQAPFTDEAHVFVNMGDGTYAHSGSLAIRAAVMANVTMTFKLLFNGAVAMTGGQPVDTSIPDIVHQLRGEKVAKIVVVADDVSRYEDVDLGVEVFDRAKLDDVQRDLRETPGVTVLIYDQACATEARRKIKRGLMKPKTTRAFINTDVCEGCGDCSVQSNCLSVEPAETEFGTKRAINQNTCNLDTSCVKGFCPSFVTVEGAVDAHRLHKKAPIDASDAPEPALPPIDKPWNIVFTGVGGTGVTTMAAILGTAAHIDGAAAVTLDMTGLAQKGGPVLSHIRIAKNPEDLRSGRTPTAGADLAIMGDLIVAASPEALSLCDAERTHAIGNWDIAPTAEFIRDRTKRFDTGYLQRRVGKATASEAGLNAESLAAEYFYDNVYANTILLGFAWAQGLVPVSREAIVAAFTLNGAGVKENIQAFDLGRAYAHDPARFTAVQPARSGPKARTLDDLIAHRAGLLTAYQDEAYAQRYRAAVAGVMEKERAAGLGEKFTRAVAVNLYKLMAYKDEYEVARLYTNGAWKKALREAFAGKLAVHFHLAPPLLSRKGADGRPKKITFDYWMYYVFQLLARLKFLRGGAFDPFGMTAERKQERRLRDDYEAAMTALAAELSPATHDLAVRLAEIPDLIRGYGPVKDAGVATAQAEEKRVRAAYAEARQAAAPAPVAAE
ncbi:MAG: indolepyruvate ferredoxin oxidoreductase family protein [Hyphomonadaceae bacterium]